MKPETSVPRRLDFRGCAVALSVREQKLLEEASEELYPTIDVPYGIVIGRMASEVIEARSQPPVRY